MLTYYFLLSETTFVSDSKTCNILLNILFLLLRIIQLLPWTELILSISTCWPPRWNGPFQNYTQVLRYTSSTHFHHNWDLTMECSISFSIVCTVLFAKTSNKLAWIFQPLWQRFPYGCSEKASRSYWWRLCFAGQGNSYQTPWFAHCTHWHWMYSSRILLYHWRLQRWPFQVQGEAEVSKWGWRGCPPTSR